MSTRFHYTIKQKLHILQLVREEQWYQLATRFPKVTQKQINEWSQKEEEMLLIPENERSMRFTLHPGPEIRYKELYQFLYQTFKHLRSENKAVTGDYLLFLAESEETRLKELSPKGRHSLVQRFMHLYNLSIREITGHSGYQPEVIPEEQREMIEKFKDNYRQIILEKGIPRQNIWNMDQTSIYYENPTSRTIELKGTKEVCAKTQGDERKRVTLFSLMNAKGELSTQLVVFKGTPDARIHAEVQGYDDLLTYHTVQENSWTDGLILIEWIYKIWRPFCQFTEGPKVLLLDAHPLHKELQKSFEVFDAQVLLIPAGFTWTLQPLDAGYHKILKEHLRKLWTRSQHKVFPTEKDKRKALSDSLKATHEYLVDNFDHSVFWKKAGLDYPDLVDSNPHNSIDAMVAIEPQDIPRDRELRTEGIIRESNHDLLGSMTVQSFIDSRLKDSTDAMEVIEPQGDISRDREFRTEEILRESNVSLVGNMDVQVERDASMQMEIEESTDLA